MLAPAQLSMLPEGFDFATEVSRCRRETGEADES
jgi:hypothetical protein